MTFEFGKAQWEHYQHKKNKTIIEFHNTFEKPSDLPFYPILTKLDIYRINEMKQITGWNLIRKNILIWITQLKK